MLKIFLVMFLSSGISVLKNEQSGVRRSQRPLEDRDISETLNRMHGDKKKL